jgi:hypothetical protein
VIWGLAWRRHGTFNVTSIVSRLCFTYHRGFEQFEERLRPCLLATLDSDVLPAWHYNGFSMVDMRPQWPGSSPAASPVPAPDGHSAGMTIEDVIRVLTCKSRSN